MDTTYIQFDAPRRGVKMQDDNIIKRLIKRSVKAILSKVIPAANPDFENKIDAVKVWLIECDRTSGIPQREIGLNSQGMVIVKMPYNENYGYWTDNNLVLLDFEQHFKISAISKEHFEKNWEADLHLPFKEPPR